MLEVPLEERTLINLDLRFGSTGSLESNHSRVEKTGKVMETISLFKVCFYGKIYNVKFSV